MSNKKKILVLDIETKPAKAYVWRLWDENIGLEQLIEPGGMICFGARFFGERKMHFYSEWRHGHREMVEAAHRLISEADAVVTYNGDKFDLPKLHGEFLLHGLQPPPPVTSIDVIKTVKKLGLQSNKLAFVGPFYKVGEKIKNEGFGLWRAVMEGDRGARARMKEYCKQDVNLLIELYDFIRPYIRNHPHLGETGGGDTCGNCGGKHLHSRGYRRTKTFKIQRLQCQTCGSWQDGKREKVT